MTHHIYRENRIGVVGGTRRVALDPLKFRGEQVVALTGGEYVRYTVLNEDGTTLADTVDASYGLIYTTEGGDEVLAWSGVIDLGLEAQTIQIVWDVVVGAARERYTDAIDVQASPYADRAVQFRADGLLVST